MRRSIPRLLPARLLPALLSTALLTASLTACTSEPPAGAGSDEPAPLTLGWNRPAEPVRVELPTGNPIQAPGSASPVDPGKPVLVNFWASWCGPCRDEMPLLAQVAGRDDVEVVGVSLDRSERYAVEFLEEVDADYPSWRDPDMEYMLDFAPSVSPSRLPATVLVVDGEVVAAHAGEFTAPEDLSAERLRELARG